MCCDWRNLARESAKQKIMCDTLYLVSNPLEFYAAFFKGWLADHVLLACATPPLVMKCARIERVLCTSSNVVHNEGLVSFRSYGKQNPRRFLPMVEVLLLKLCRLFSWSRRIIYDFTSERTKSALKPPMVPARS